MKRRPLTDAPERLEPEERRRIIAWAAENVPQFDLERLSKEWGRCRRWHLENQKQRRRWDLTFENWLEHAAEFDVEKRARGKGERIKLDGPVSLGVILGGKANG